MAGIDKRINSYQRAIKKLKGAVFCEKCDNELQENALFCDVCGYKVADPVIKMSEDQARCEKCGFIYKKGAHYCINCGNRLEEESLVEDVVEVHTHRMCVNCGTKLDIEALFCTECGTRQ